MYKLILLIEKTPNFHKWRPTKTTTNYRSPGREKEDLQDTSPIFTDDPAATVKLEAPPTSAREKIGRFSTL